MFHALRAMNHQSTLLNMLVSKLMDIFIMFVSLYAALNVLRTQHHDSISARVARYTDPQVILDKSLQPKRLAP